jgi:hypothetical protein
MVNAPPLGPLSPSLQQRPTCYSVQAVYQFFLRRKSWKSELQLKQIWSLGRQLRSKFVHRKATQGSRIRHHPGSSPDPSQPEQVTPARAMTRDACLRS